MRAAVSTYLARLDGHVELVADPRERIRLIDDERYRVDRVERALSEWAAREDERPAPTRFSAFDLAVLHGELSLRMEQAREEAQAPGRRGEWRATPFGSNPAKAHPCG
jgi:hypothetical protein